MKRSLQGRYLKVATPGEAFKAFVPAPLPPRPAIHWTPALRGRFDAALVTLGRLDAVTDLLPNAGLLLYSFVRKEAVLSLMIEGTQSSLADLMLFELDEQPGVPVEDVREVSRYVAALEHGLGRLRGGFPLSLRLLREVHKVLLGRGRGAKLTPGEFRRSQVWIGGTRPGNAVFVPPPANEMDECLKHFERFLHDQPEPTPPLIKAALAHVQFETIHPFLDGNGRVGQAAAGAGRGRWPAHRSPRPRRGFRAGDSPRAAAPADRHRRVARRRHRPHARDREQVAGAPGTSRGGR